MQNLPISLRKCRVLRLARSTCRDKVPCYLSDLTPICSSLLSLLQPHLSPRFSSDMTGTPSPRNHGSDVPLPGTVFTQISMGCIPSLPQSLYTRLSFSLRPILTIPRNTAPSQPSQCFLPCCFLRSAHSNLV